MARTVLAIQNVARTGLLASYTAANVDGHSVSNDGRTFLHVKNGVTAVVVTLVIPRTIDGQAPANRTVTVADSTDEFIGPFPPDTYNQGGAVGDSIHIDFDTITNVTIAALRI